LELALNDEDLKQQILEAGAQSREALDQAQTFARSRRRPLAEALLELGLMSEAEIYKSMAKANGMPFVDPGSKNPGCVDPREGPCGARPREPSSARGREGRCALRGDR